MGFFDKGKDDASKGRGPQDMRNAPAQTREKYDAGYKQQQDKNQKK